MVSFLEFWTSLIEQVDHDVSLESKGGQRGDKKAYNVFKSIVESSKVAQEVQRAVSLTAPNCLVLAEVEIEACKLELVRRVVFRWKIYPRGLLRSSNLKSMKRFVVCLSKLKIACFIFKLVSLKRAFNPRVVALRNLCRVKH